MPGSTSGHERLRVTATGLELRLRDLRPDDETALFAMFRSVVAAGEGYPQDPAVPLDDEEIRAYWIGSWPAVVVATTTAPGPGRIVGSYFLKPNGVGRAAHVANAGYLVAADARDQGIGTLLVEHSMARALDLGFDALQFNFVFESNPARRLYERMGFEVVGRVPDVIDGQAVLVYWKRLTPEG